MTDFIAEAIAERKLGLALHYPLLHAALIGLDAKSTLEFGAGGSTRVFLEALPCDATHYSISTETGQEIAARHGFRGARGMLPSAVDGLAWRPMWFHLHGLSEKHREVVMPWFDLILHDGSHAADVVADDIAWAWPHLRPFGLLMVHDTQHSYVGVEMREGVRRGLEKAGARFTVTTLPYGFGLTIIRREEDGPDAVTPAQAKVSSPHATEPMEFRP